MTYGGQQYTDVITVEDKSDPYVSEMLSIGGFTVKNNLGGVVPYVIVRTNRQEVDPLLGSISETAPSSPASAGSTVNLENDCIGKYVERLLAFGSTPKEKTESRITEEFLIQNGF